MEFKRWIDSKVQPISQPMVGQQSSKPNLSWSHQGPTLASLYDTLKDGYGVASRVSWMQGATGERTCPA